MKIGMLLHPSLSIPCQNSVKYRLLAALIVWIGGACSANASPISQDVDALAEMAENEIIASTPITDCVFMALTEGQYHLKSTGTQKICGIYVASDPDKQVVISFDYTDVTCTNGGLVSVIDGWELGGEFFPGNLDHPKSISHRFHEFCGPKKPKTHYLASQNVALIQYRIPAEGEGFQITVHFIKNLSPCNVLLQGFQGMYTLRNYGQTINCSISAIFPSHIDVVSMSVGVQGRGASVELETGIKNKCFEKGMHDYVQVIGSNGLDPTMTIPSATLCGLDSNPQNVFVNILCGTSTIRLISSGNFDDSITVSFRQLDEEESLTAQVSCLDRK